jgi:DNA ligase (NAD+)
LKDGETLQGKIVVLTGKLTRFSRDKAAELIESVGGTVAEHLNKKTDYLVAGADAGSKLDSARSLGVTTISEEEFLKFLEVSQATVNRE